MKSTVNEIIRRPPELAGLEVPEYRVIDGVDQTSFFAGERKNSNRDGFHYWMGDTCYGVKWRSFKMVLVLQKTLSDPALHLATPHLINLDTDPKERNPYDFPYLHTWVIEHTGKILRDFQLSVQREPFIPVGAPLDYVPTTMQWKLMFHRHARRSAEKFRASKRLRALAPAGVGDRP